MFDPSAVSQVYVPVPLSQWLTPAMLATIATTLVTVIGAMAAGVVKIIHELHNTQEQLSTNTDLIHDRAREGREVGAVRDASLARIELQVNGRYLAVLQEIADLRTHIARYSGIAEDQLLADAAHQRVETERQSSIVKKFDVV